MGLDWLQLQANIDDDALEGSPFLWTRLLWVMKLACSDSTGELPSYNLCQPQSCQANHVFDKLEMIRERYAQYSTVGEMISWTSGSIYLSPNRTIVYSS